MKKEQKGYSNEKWKHYRKEKIKRENGKIYKDNKEKYREGRSEIKNYISDILYVYVQSN